MSGPFFPSVGHLRYDKGTSRRRTVDMAGMAVDGKQGNDSPCPQFRTGVF